MVIIRNIKIDNDFVEFDYFPEDQEEKGYIKYNYKTDETIDKVPTSYDNSMDYLGHAKVAISRLLKTNKDIPKEICEMWY